MKKNCRQKHCHQNPINDFHRFVRQRNIRIEIVKSKMNEDTRIRNADEKQPFFDGQIKEFNTRMVPRIETPHSYFGKNNIPNNEENCRNNYRRKNCFPAFDILHPVFETVEKRDQKGCNI